MGIVTIKKKDIITSGLTSELFLLAFLKEDSGYALGSRLQNRKNPDMSKVYPALTALTQSKHLKHYYDDGDKSKRIYYVNRKKLTEEITKVLAERGKSLNKDESEALEKLYEPVRWVQTYSSSIINKIHKQSKGIHHVSALEEIYTQIGFLASMFLLREQTDVLFRKQVKKSRQIPRDEFFKVMPEIFEVFQLLGNVPMIKKEMEKDGRILTDEELEVVKQFSNLMIQWFPMMHLLLLPRSSIKKLSVLYDKSDIFFEGGRIAIENLKRVQKYKKDPS